MTDEMMILMARLDGNADSDLLGEMIGFTAKRLIELEVEGLTGAELAMDNVSWRDVEGPSVRIPDASRPLRVGLFRRLLWIDFASQAQLRVTPLFGEGVVEIFADRSVELVDVHVVDTIVEALVLGARPRGRRRPSGAVRRHRAAGMPGTSVTAAAVFRPEGQSHASR